MYLQHHDRLVRGNWKQFSSWEKLECQVNHPCTVPAGGWDARPVTSLRSFQILFFSFSNDNSDNFQNPSPVILPLTAGREDETWMTRCTPRWTSRLNEISYGRCELIKQYVICLSVFTIKEDFMQVKATFHISKLVISLLTKDVLQRQSVERNMIIKAEMTLVTWSTFYITKNWKLYSVWAKRKKKKRVRLRHRCTCPVRNSFYHNVL